MKKRILVTGASRGIGRAIALTLSKSNYHVTINYLRNEAMAQECLKEIINSGGEGMLLPFDVSDRVATRIALEEVVVRDGSYWGVVCNAGVTSDAPFPSLTGEAWDSVIQTNLGGLYNVLNPLVMPMVQARNGGRIVTISSVSGLVGNRGQVNYSAAKAGIIGATRSLAQELAKRNITVNSVAPGLIETDMVADAPIDLIKKQIPMRRLGKPEEVASIVAYLFDDMAGYITGQVISVNGGVI
jgi:3-oxoacyl-[acyl-carrier protein] reductase